MCLDLPSDVLGHALVDAFVRLLGILDHQGTVLQQVQAVVIFHVDLVTEKQPQNRQNLKGVKKGGLPRAAGSSGALCVLLQIGVPWSYAETL